MKATIRLVAATSVLLLCAGISASCLVFLHWTKSEYFPTTGTGLGTLETLQRNLLGEYVNMQVNTTDALLPATNRKSATRGGEAKLLLRRKAQQSTSVEEDHHLVSSVSHCADYIEFSDLDESGSLNEQEILILASLLADSDTDGVVANNFQELQESLEVAFDNLASAGGEILFAQTNADSNQRLMNVFQHTEAKTLVSKSTICSEVVANIGSQSSQTTTTKSESRGQLQECTKEFELMFDANKDGRMSTAEYAAFVQAVAHQPLEKTFPDLPRSVQNIFFAQVVREQQIPFATIDEGGPSYNHILQASFDGICAKAQQIIDTMMDIEPQQLPLVGSPLSPQATPRDNSSPFTAVEDMQIPAPLDSLFQNETSCNNNPLDFNVNVDIQITYLPNDLACRGIQDNVINTNIQEALNEGFATAVADWQGEATFGTFVFDTEQEVNNNANDNPFGGFRRLAKRSSFPIQRILQSGTCQSRAAVDCTADYCRWGCITASTTSCGNPSSTTNNWTNLEGVVRDRLASLGFDCLGIAGLLQVALVVDAPVATNATSPTTTATTNTTMTNTTPLFQGNNTNSTWTNTTLSATGNLTIPLPRNVTSANITTPLPRNVTSPNISLLGNITIPGNITNTTAPNGTTPVPTVSPTLAPPATPSPTSNITAPTITPQSNAAVPTTLPPTTAVPTTLLPSLSPTLASPTVQPAPTPAPGPSETITGYNSWIMSNTLGQNAAALRADATAYNGIKNAYASFTDDFVAEMVASRVARFRLRRRRLVVSKQAGSSSVDSIVDSTCPDFLAADFQCITVFGSARIVTDENTTDVYAEYVDGSQLAIDVGQLQQSLNEEAPGSLWTVALSSTPVNPADFFPDPSTDAPEEDRGGSDLNLGLVISGAIAAFLVAVILLLVIVPACRKNRDLKQARKEALEALRESEAKHLAAMNKKQAKEQKGDKPSGPPWPKKDHNEEDNPYRDDIKWLMEHNCPEFIDELNSLLHQYQGREEELIAMLEDFGENESVLDMESGDDSDLSSSSESESESVADASVYEDVPVAEIEVEESTEEMEIARNIGDEDTVESENEVVAVEESEDVQVEDEEVEEEGEEAEDDEEMEESESESSSSLSHGIFIVPREARGLEPPDDDVRFEPEESFLGKGLEPPDDTERQLEPEEEEVFEARSEPRAANQRQLEPEEEDEVFEAQAVPPSEPYSESEQDQEATPIEEPEEEISEEPLEEEMEVSEVEIGPRDGVAVVKRAFVAEVPKKEEPPVVERAPASEPEMVEEPPVVREAPVPEPEKPKLPPKPTPVPVPEKLKPPPKPTPVGKREEDDTETWLSSESSEEGYRIKWFQKNGCWLSEKVPIGEDFSEESTEYFSSDSDSDEEFEDTEKDWKWVKNVRGWSKEHVENIAREENLLDDDDESYFSSSSESDEDLEGPRWVRKNGQWRQEICNDEASLGYSDDSRY